ncbi:hypothetical protein [Gloeobacter kilaueensis]|uniref:Lipoprotein n=1 Tax=Gloeobacter kilaueensis (strain ATCC BAA-2537 / CCAP 1431/1 / ULC 316 / JS1) TaxID=1183438 RepID=U5QC31_GLOK1|nr:hypothetical protein [Gloeobacter kilaueensis]AGY56373.1 hypothetical protein GKIL_0126 [Gloeobacter kilaueensis JS1]
MQTRFSLRKSLAVLMAVTLTVTTVACSDSTSREAGNRQSAAERSEQSRLPDGQYPLQQASYNDANGEYTLLLLNTPPGSPSSLRTAQLPLARLTDDDVKAGKKSYLKVEGGNPALYLTPDAKIEYVRNVAQTQTNPQTGEQQTVVVRQESSFWTPFAASLAGAAIGNALFAPRYYVPPVYSPGGLVGYGGFGSTYNQAVTSYQQRTGSLPAAERNSRSFRSTSGFGSSSTRQPVGSNSTRSSGSGFGGSTLRSSDPSSGSSYNRSRSSSGSGFGSSRSRSFGRRR